jgi:glutamate receptor, ionotropic, plant
LESNLSRFLVIIWVFVVLILTSSYTASLTSMLTVQQLQPTITDVNELLRRGDYIGYQDGSFVVALLKRLNFDTSKMRNYSTVDQYAEALAKGSANGGVAAIFDEIPYLKVFLSKYCANHTMVGPTYKTDGFGFVSFFIWVFNTN